MQNNLYTTQCKFCFPFNKPLMAFILHNVKILSHQASLSMGFSRQEYWSGLPFPSPGGLPDPVIEPTLPTDALPSEPPGKPQKLHEWVSEVAQSCPTVCNPMDCSPADSSVHRILQPRILEWVAISCCKVSSWPRDQTRSPALQGDALPSELKGLEAVKWTWPIKAILMVLHRNDF